MIETAQITISQTFLSVVEQLTLMFGEPVDKDELNLTNKDFTRASMSFTGDLTGTLTIVVGSKTLLEIAANILGLETADVSRDVVMQDALGEMLNVICGRVIVALAGGRADFELGSPVSSGVSSQDLVEIVASPDFVGFELDDAPVFLGLVTES